MKFERCSKTLHEISCLDKDPFAWYQTRPPHHSGIILSIQMKPLILFFFCNPSFIKIEIRTVNDRYMFIFEILHVIWSVLSFFLVIFVKKKKTPLYLFFVSCFVDVSCILYSICHLHCFLMLIKESHSLASAFIWQTSYISIMLELNCRNIQSEMWLCTVK